VRYLVDGYNFLFRLSADWRFDLRRQREVLIRAFNEKIEEANLDLTLVFDGADMPRGEFTRGHWKSVEVVYTHEDLSADDYILHRLDEAKHPKLYTVVTSDRSLKLGAKNRGASVISVKDFLTFLKKKKRRRLRTKRAVSDTRGQIDRLRKIFEKKLQDEEEV
jgi:predicted RNA-binding protein with PIN domain